MDTLHELLDFLRAFGLNLEDLPALIAKNVAAKATKRLAGASKAVIENFAARLRSWRERGQLEADLESSSSSAEREALIRESLERWIHERGQDASETIRHLFRIVYLRALKAHCSDLPVVANLVFTPQNLVDVWVPQDFRLGASAGRSEARKGESRRQQTRNLSQAIAAGGSRIVVEGAAGSGKSTQLRKLVLDRVADLLNLEDFDRFLDEPLPVYINAVDLLEGRHDLATNLEAAVGSSIGLRLPFPIPAGFFDRRQRGAAKSLLLVVDGVNEVAVSKQNYLVSVFGAPDGELARDTTVIFGSGSLDHSSSQPWHGFSQIEVSDLDPAQATSLLEKLLGARIAKNFIDRNPRLPLNPMLLTLAALLQSEKAVSSKAILYQEFILALLKKRSDLALLPDDPKAILRLLSCFANAAEPFDVDGLVRIADELRLISPNALGLARRQAAESLLTATGIVTRRSGRLEFVHHSFRSYLRAEHLVQLHPPQIGNVWDRISPFREGWETVAFLCEIWIP